MQEPDAEQPTVQTRSQCSSSDEPILINERKCEDITAKEYSHTQMSWNTISQNLLEKWYAMQIAETEKQMEQFIRDLYVRG